MAAKNALLVVVQEFQIMTDPIETRAREICAEGNKSWPPKEHCPLPRIGEICRCCREQAEKELAND